MKEDNLGLLDCTLRDGGYPIQFQFTTEDTHRIAKKLDRAGISLVEVGHGLGMNAQAKEYSNAAASDREYIEAAVSAVSEADVGVFFIPNIGRKRDIREAVDAGADFIRVGTNVTEWRKMEDYLRLADEHGLTVCANFMKTYAANPEKIEHISSKVSEWGAEVVYVVDSAGGMLPNEVEDYIGAAVSGVEGDATVGFHCHDNLKLSVSNSLVAVEAGARWVDATLQGIGRSAGNTPTEVLSIVLSKQGYNLALDTNSLMDTGEQEISPLVGSNETDPIDVTSGYALFHTKFLRTVLEASENHGIDPRDLIVEVSRKNLVNPSENLVYELAEEIAEDSSEGQDRQTSYLRDSENRAMDIGQVADVEEISEKVKRNSRKFGKKGVLSVTKSFRDFDKPRPTVVHRSEQAILGNVEVSSASQANEVLTEADGNVDTLMLDSRMDLEEINIQQHVSNILYYDGGLAISRALKYFINQSTERKYTVEVIGDNATSQSLVQILSSDARCESAEIVKETEAGGSDVIVGFTINEVETFNPSSVQLVIDAGIGSFSDKVLEKIKECGIDTARSDVRAGYITEIECSLITHELFESVMGSRMIDGVRIVAGGIIGDEGDVVVDSVKNTGEVYGIADGSGGVRDPESKKEEDRLNKVYNYIQRVNR